jgi:hypothetical protein
MPYNLIPFPISIFFVFVFGAAVLAVLWKLRERGKLFVFLFYLSLIVAIVVFALFSYSIAVSILKGLQNSTSPQPTLVPYPSVPG